MLERMLFSIPKTLNLVAKFEFIAICYNREQVSYKIAASTE